VFRWITDGVRSRSFGRTILLMRKRTKVTTGAQKEGNSGGKRTLEQGDSENDNNSSEKDNRQCRENGSVVSGGQPSAFCCTFQRAARHEPEHTPVVMKLFDGAKPPHSRGIVWRISLSHRLAHSIQSLAQHQAPELYLGTPRLERNYIGRGGQCSSQRKTFHDFPGRPARLPELRSMLRFEAPGDATLLFEDTVGAMFRLTRWMGILFYSQKEG